MTKSVSVALLSAVAAVAVTWFLFHSGGPAIPDSSEFSAVGADVSVIDTAITRVSARTAEANVIGTQIYPIAENDERVAAATTKIADMFDQGLTSTLVGYFTSKGLSREDSERVVAEGVQDMVTCVLDAVRAEAAAQVAPFEDMLDAMLAGTPPWALPNLLLSGDVSDCMAIVRQRMGLPATSFELRAHGLKFGLGARVLLE